MRRFVMRRFVTKSALSGLAIDDATGVTGLVERR